MIIQIHLHLAHHHCGSMLIAPIIMRSLIKHYSILLKKLKPKKPFKINFIYFMTYPPCCGMEAICRYGLIQDA